MTIDEAIAKYKEITNTDTNCPIHCMRSCDKCVQESGQLAAWLEELKELRATSCGYSKEDIELNRNAMYNKAIDDFVKSIRDIVFSYYTNEAYIKYDDLLMKATQLKVGDGE